ncbi:L-aspartate oxidase [bacterium]|nr:L-aspartate oxidase [bacterium]
MAALSTGQVVILGAGLAGLHAALALAPRPVLLISPEPLGQGASSAWAQGGVAAAMDRHDSPEAHAEDTLRAGAGLVDAGIARVVTEEARAQILALTEIGTAFDRGPDGSYLLSREAAHRFARVVRVCGDGAGAEIMRALVARVRACPSAQIVEVWQAVSLLQERGRLRGVEIQPAGGGDRHRIAAPAVLLAGGGSGGLFATTTNPARIRGEAAGMAARAGAVMADMEFVQFHPTAMDIGLDPAPLATEALRGEGALLVNRLGERFMLGQHPDRELAPRDVVGRAVHDQWVRGLRPALDLTQAPGPSIMETFPSVARACIEAGLDPLREPLPVCAAAHFHMGGVETDARGRSSVAGLWVCGEAACTGLHGANRLASNGLLEALVFARLCAEDIAATVGDTPADRLQMPVRGGVTEEIAPEVLSRLRRSMTLGAGVVRTAEGLRATLREIAAVEAAAGAHPGLRNMTATATVIAAAALQRRESIGAHYRSDAPQTLSVPPRRSHMTLAEALRIRDDLTKEPA